MTRAASNLRHGTGRSLSWGNREGNQTPWRIDMVRSFESKISTRIQLAADRRRVVQQEVSWTAMRVIGVRNRASRWPWVDLLLSTVVHPLHSRVTAVCQTLHHLASANSASTTWSASGTVTRRSAVRAKVAAVVQTPLLPADRPRCTSRAATAIATAAKFAKYPAATGIALLAAVVTARVVAQAPGSA